MNDDDVHVDAAHIEELVFSLSPQNDCQVLLQTLNRLSEEAVKSVRT